ncbi:MAG: ATP-dependent RNA helicase HrpA, partial [Gammaproteobacteria bacterium]|nr:ATP-dependent RNA helicase HrpA [Gammaproteobacteria bacterium]
IKLVTDGLLLTEIRSDRFLDRYDVIILDEAHERSLNVDFLIGYLKQLLVKRRDLKLIITSATIDVTAFSKHFWDAPVVEVSGRSYPVEVRYCPGEVKEETLLTCIEEIDRGPRLTAGDVLIFQSGEREIFETARTLRREFADRFDILPLYARLSLRDQQRVFSPGKRRRIILATNVAETSLTVPNIGYVIDPGVARVSRYSYRSKLQRLPIEPISQASANQRTGRCGRIAPGVCFRLYDETDFLSRPEYTDPEIHRTNLASVVLQMRAFGLGDEHSFPFLDPPDPRAIRDAHRLLDELGALLENKLTKIGRIMARLPVDPRLARMLVAADQHRSLTETLIIVSALAIADPRERPLEKQGSADQAHAQFADSRSDFLALVNLWNWHEQARQEMTRAALGRELVKRFLSYTRMREWRELHRQLLLASRDQGLRANTTPAKYSSIHRALLAGSLSLIGHHDEKGNYIGARDLRFRIFPGSTLAGRTPKWLMAAVITETRRVYARDAASVEARWIEEAGAHLLKRQHTEPHWSARRGEVLAYENVSLYGLKLAERRRVSYAKIDPALCRELFIREGLVRGAIVTRLDFLEHNQRLIAEIVETEAKGRRRDLLVDEHKQTILYAERIPDDVCSVSQLQHWLRRKPEAGRRLFFNTAELKSSVEVRYQEVEYPSELVFADARLAVKYRFAPGELDDGVSIQVPVGVLGSLIEGLLQWSVPGFFPAVCEQWIKTLPKQKRRLLAPVPDKMAEIMPILLNPDCYRQGRMLPALARCIEDHFGVRIEAGDWDQDRVDSHLLVNVQVLDEQGRLLDQSRDVETLKTRFAEQVERRMTDGLRAGYEQNDLTEFPDVELASSVLLESGQVTAYPALVDQLDHVDLRLFTSRLEQIKCNRNGYARLALLQVRPTARFLKKELGKDKEIGLHFAMLGGAEQLRDELLRAASWYAFFEGRPLPVNRASFEQCITVHRGQLAEIFTTTVSQLKDILVLRSKVMRRLDELTSPAYEDAQKDVREQLATLVPADVLAVTPRHYLAELPRYLEASHHRLVNLQGKVQKDRNHCATIRGLENRLQRLSNEGIEHAQELTVLRFTIQELRIALFAEPKRTKGKVSAKRIDSELSALERNHGLI